MKNIRRFLLASTVVCLAACDTGPKGSAGFTLPDGDVERGKAQYIALQCNACHENQYVPQLVSDTPAPISVVLGGQSARIRTYGELVTSIINPSHRIAHRFSKVVADESGSLMTNYNSMMTVSELIDLVAFVQSSYELPPLQTTAYPVYWHPDMPEDKE
jgi:sulfur-oxidizing protein SoxX